MPQVYLTSFFGSGKCCLQVMGGVRGVTKDVAQISIVVYGWGNPRCKSVRRLLQDLRPLGRATQGRCGFVCAGRSAWRWSYLRMGGRSIRFGAV